MKFVAKILPLIVGLSLMWRKATSLYCDDPNKCGENCMTNCNGPCKDSKCDQASCDCESCPEGKFGATCEDCSQGCITPCTFEDGKCDCKAGYGDNQCKTECPACEKCDSSGKCTKCVDDLHYGDGCSTPCDQKCQGNKCNMDGKCIKCKDGYYGDDCLQCDSKCAKCESANQCTSCKGAFYDIMCDKSCGVGCADSQCDFTDGTCTCTGNYDLPKCICNRDVCTCANDKCTECNDKTYYGDDCKTKCNQICFEGKCNFDGTCIKCPPGFYGAACDQPCNSKCATCVSADSCTSCKGNFFGPLCSTPCGAGCKDDGACGVLDGACDCKAGYGGAKCDVQCQACAECDSQGQCTSCPINFYGPTCQTQCGIGCRDRKCDFSLGTCTCKDNYDLPKCICNRDVCTCANDKCTECNDKTYYGENCQTQCSSKCFEGKCNFDGTCIKCPPGYYGAACDQPCNSKCATCVSADSCTSCKGNFYGPLCSTPCGAGCKDDGACGFLDGACDCNEGYVLPKCICNQNVCTCAGDKCTECFDKEYYGDDCKNKCKEGCVESKCEIDGSCSCAAGYYSPDCSKCDSKCATCESADKCTYCQDGYYGEKCDQGCGNGCKDNKCGFSDGKCPCNEGFGGDKCDITCLSVCSKCDNIEKCTECRDKTHYGEDCSSQCSIGCINRECKFDGTCPCQGDYVGTKCEFLCNKQKCTECNVLGKCLGCVGDFYDDECIKPCGEGCLAKCTFGTGACDCKDGYKGTKCNCDLSKCAECDEDGKCTVCPESKHYGDDCSIPCGEGCLNKQCGITGNCECIDLGWIEPKCDTTCDIVHCTECNTAGECIDCQKGFYGNKCLTECNKGCQDQKCDSKSGTCSCIDGFVGDMCDVICNLNVCIQCTPEGKCSECKIGFFGENCSKFCGEGCANQCAIDTGKCRCKPNYSGPLCNCDTIKCSQCTGEGACSECHTKFYGLNCENKCGAGCSDDKCGFSDGKCTCKSSDYEDEKCNCDKRICASCDSEGNCTECQDKTKYGVDCSKPCEIGCQEGKCDINGACSCNDGYHGTNCDSLCEDHCAQCDLEGLCTKCNTTYHGEHCEKSCGAGCDKGECKKDDGTCTCLEGYKPNTCECNTKICINGCSSGDICTECPDGKYDFECSGTCSEGCIDNKCALVDAKCTCKEGFTGSKCNCNLTECVNGCDNEEGKCIPCQEGKYGKDCAKTCSEHCLGNKCTLSNGTCTCKDPSFVGPNCDIPCLIDCINGCNEDGTCKQCGQGKWGQGCAENCAEECLGGGCDLKDGSCTCKDDSFVGSQCTIPCDLNKCINKCNNIGGCIQCPSKKYGVNCLKDCGQGCEGSGNCDLVDGHCTCATTYWGTNCNKQCSTNCVNGQCKQDEGTCDCQTDYYGAQCTKSCSKSCVQGCNQYTGKCNKCEDDFTGLECEDKCNEGCGGKCNQDGTCSCKENYWGLKCEKKCNDGCDSKKGNCNQIEGTCKCLTPFYGTQCNLKCSIGCIENENCNQIEGTCNCKAGYYGLQCRTECAENCTDIKGCDQKTGACVECESGSYGEKCDQVCNAGCNEACDKEDGHCECKETHYGEKCEKGCSEGCVLPCNKQNGSCSCLLDYYGETCTKRCVPACERRCQQDTGYCSSCPTGLQGDHCETACNPGCEGACNQQSGACNCKFDYFGETCNETCLCKLGCHKNGTCLECPPGNYTAQCNEECAQGCDPRVCDQWTGKCKCSKEFWGENCEKKCQSGCKDKCNQDTGTCECQKGYYGLSCDKSCGKGCNYTLQPYCDKVSGNCLCDNNFWGENCDEGCAECSANGCDSSGFCPVECNEGFFGISCQQTCSCVNSSSIEGQKNTCSKYSGQCLNCIFGTYGTKCESHCYYLCKTLTCCIFKSNENQSSISFDSQHNSFQIDIEIEDQPKTFAMTRRDVLVDYSFGTPLILYSSEADKGVCNIKNTINVKGKAPLFKKGILHLQGLVDIEGDYYDFEVKFTGQSFTTRALVATKLKCSEGIDLQDGIIGMGFSSRFIYDVIKAGHIKYHLVSIQPKEDNSISVRLGQFHKEVLDQFDRIISCNLNKESNFDIICELAGIINNNDKKAYKTTFGGSYAYNISFSASQNSAFTFKDKEKITEYFTNSILDPSCVSETKDDLKTIYCPQNILEASVIPKVGFVINNSILYYAPNLLFVENPDKSDTKKFYKFIINFTSNDNNVKLVIGKDFLKQTHLALNSEQNLVHIYYPNNQYLRTELLGWPDTFGKDPVFVTSPLFGYICLAIIFASELILFLFYFCYKRAKIRKSQYVKI